MYMYVCVMNGCVQECMCVHVTGVCLGQCMSMCAHGRCLCVTIWDGAYVRCDKCMHMRMCGTVRVQVCAYESVCLCVEVCVGLSEPGGALVRLGI